MKTEKRPGSELADKRKRVKFSGKPAERIENRNSNNFEEEDEEGFLETELEKRKSRHRLKTDDAESEDDFHMLDGEDDDEKEVGRMGRKDDRLFDVDSDVEEENPEDDDETTKEIPIEPFNMRQEMEEGHFEDGTYIKHNDDDQHHDSWLTGISKKEIKEAALAQKKREEKELSAERANSKPADLMEDILKYLQPGESILNALARLGAKNRRKGNKNKYKNVMDISEPSIKDDTRKDIEHLTELADKLLADGFTDVYEETYEKFSQRVQAAQLRKPQDMWQYRWENDGEIYGPYTTTHMREWKAAGYFTETTSIRKVIREPNGVVTFMPFEPLTNQI